MQQPQKQGYLPALDPGCSAQPLLAELKSSPGAVLCLCSVLGSQRRRMLGCPVPPSALPPLCFTWCPGARGSYTQNPSGAGLRNARAERWGGEGAAGSPSSGPCNRTNRLSEVGLSRVTFQHEPSRARYPQQAYRDVKGSSLFNSVQRNLPTVSPVGWAGRGLQPMLATGVTGKGAGLLWDSAGELWDPWKLSSYGTDQWRCWAERCWAAPRAQPGGGV